MEKELASTRARLTKELSATRHDLELEIDQRTRLQVLEQEQYQELQFLRQKVKELETFKPLAEKLTSDLESERFISKSAKESLEKCNTELSSYKRRINTTDKESRKQASVLKDTKSELDRIRAENQEFLSGRDAAMESQRAAFAEKSRKDLAAWKSSTEERVGQATKEAKEHYTVVFESKKQELATLKKEFLLVKSEKDKAELQLEGMLTVRADLSSKISTLETQYGADRKMWHESKNVLENQVSRLREEALSKDSEYNSLMDCKLALDAEISTYRMILDQEESRVGVIKTPKRARHASKQRTPSTKKKAKLMMQSDVRICQLDIQRDLVVIENLGSKPLELTGWVLTSEAENKSFTYPNFTLAPNDKAAVICGKAAKTKAAAMTLDGLKAFSTKKYLWDSNGDAATLTNAKGQIIHRLADGLAEEPEEEEEEYSDSDPMQPLARDQEQENNCCIM